MGEGSAPPRPDQDPGQPAASVVLCTYDGARFLPELLRSLEAQTRRPDEMVVRDDVSTDGTRELLERFTEVAPFQVRLIGGDERLGPRQNFERGIAAARGELIFLADQDDRWRPEKIERLARLLTEDPDLGYAFSDAELVDADGRPLGETFWEAAGLIDVLPGGFGPQRQLTCLLERGLAPGAALAFRAQLREVALPIPEEWPHDWWLMAVAAGSGWRGKAVAEPLLEYRLHAGQATGLQRPERPSGPVARYRRHRARMAGQVERHERRLSRLERLRARLDRRLAEGPSPRVEAVLDRAVAEEAEHAAHARARERVRRGPLAEGISTLVGELRRGRYRRLSGSASSAAADVGRGDVMTARRREKPGRIPRAEGRGERSGSRERDASPAGEHRRRGRHLPPRDRDCGPGPTGRRPGEPGRDRRQRLAGGGTHRASSSG